MHLLKRTPRPYLRQYVTIWSKKKKKSRPAYDATNFKTPQILRKWSIKVYIETRSIFCTCPSMLLQPDVSSAYTKKEQNIIVYNLKYENAQISMSKSKLEEFKGNWNIFETLINRWCNFLVVPADGARTSRITVLSALHGWFRREVTINLLILFHVRSSFVQFYRGIMYQYPAGLISDVWIRVWAI